MRERGREEGRVKNRERKRYDTRFKGRRRQFIPKSHHITAQHSTTQHNKIK
jgi:hypothetical protein